LIVEGEKTKLGIGNDLFSNAAKLRRIIVPAEHCFDVYDDIINAVKLCYDNDDLILIAAGPTATVLAYDLSTEGYWAIDIGHIDIEYSWYTDNSFILINSEVNFTVINLAGNYKTPDTYVYEYIRKQYNIADDNLIKYIKNLYNYKNNWDYYSDTNIQDYKYNISMKLK
jgi:hypothetical protein